MYRRKDRQDIEFDPEIEKTARALRKKAKDLQARANMADATRDQMRRELEREFRDKAAQDQATAIEAAKQQWKDEEDNRNAGLNVRSCLEAITPRFQEHRGVVYEEIAGNQTFKIDGFVLQSLKEMQFHGLKDECPVDHLRNFLEIVNSYQVANITSDQMKLRLFQYTLAGRAKDWWWKIPDRSVHTWNELQAAFLEKFFSSARTQTFIRKIITFTQDDSESLAAAHERFEELIRKCPHHGQSEEALVRYFAQGLLYQYHDQLDTMAAGSFLDQSPAECWEMIKKIVYNSTRAHHRMGKTAGVLALSEKMHADAQASSEMFSERFNRLEKQMARIADGGSEKVATQSRVVECELCGGGHAYENCHVARKEAKVNYVQTQFGNKNSSHPNLSYGNQQSWKPAQQYQQHQQNQPPFQQQGHQFHNNNQDQPREPSLRELVAQMAQGQITANNQMNQQLSQFVAQQGKTNETVAADLRELKAQIGQVIEAVHTREPGSLPSDTRNPRHGELKSITLRSGKTVEDESTELTEAQTSARTPDKERSLPEQEAAPAMPENTTSARIPENEPSFVATDAERTTDKTTSTRSANNERSLPASQQQNIEREYPPPPFPQRLQRKKEEKGMKTFIDHLQQLTITIPFAEALASIPKYAKYMKDLLTNKSEFKLADLVRTEIVSSLTKRELPPKLSDQGAFNVPCVIGTTFVGKALCDLGASINLMPLSIFKKLGLGELKRTRMMLQMADRSVIKPYGLAEDVIVKIDNLVVPTDFVICDIEADNDVPLILGRPFLRTGRALIDVHKGEITLRVNGNEVKFNVNSSMKYPACKSCFSVCDYDSNFDSEFDTELVYREQLEMTHTNDPLHAALVSNDEFFDEETTECVNFLNDSDSYEFGRLFEPLEEPEGKKALPSTEKPPDKGKQEAREKKKKEHPRVLEDHKSAKGPTYVPPQRRESQKIKEVQPKEVIK